MSGKRVCFVCGLMEFIYDFSRGEIVCKVCGYVIEENVVDEGFEWRVFDLG